MPKGNFRLGALLGILCLGLGACAQLPIGLTQLRWQDAWGDRGTGVLARDYEMCRRLSEQRSSLMAGCMAARGWMLE